MLVAPASARQIRAGILRPPAVESTLARCRIRCRCTTARPCRSAIRGYAATQHVDLWHCEWTPYGESLHRCVPAEPCVVMAHNVESIIWQRYTENEPNPLKRWYIGRQWAKFERFERRVFAAAGRTRSPSARRRPADARAVSARRGWRWWTTAWIRPTFSPTATAREPSRLLFLGSLDWRPNLDAVGMLLDQIFPRVLAQEPSARLSIVGRKPPRWLVDRVPALPQR